jgi:hypothetical protein
VSGPLHPHAARCEPVIAAPELTRPCARRPTMRPPAASWRRSTSTRSRRAGPAGCAAVAAAPPVACSRSCSLQRRRCPEPALGAGCTQLKPLPLPRRVQATGRRPTDPSCVTDAHTALQYAQGLFMTTEQVVQSIVAPLERLEFHHRSADVTRWARAPAWRRRPSGSAAARPAGPDAAARAGRHAPNRCRPACSPPPQGRAAAGGLAAPAGPGQGHQLGEPHR